MSPFQLVEISIFNVIRIFHGNQFYSVNLTDFSVWFIEIYTNAEGKSVKIFKKSVVIKIK